MHTHTNGTIQGQASSVKTWAFTVSGCFAWDIEIKQVCRCKCNVLDLHCPNRICIVHRFNIEAVCLNSYDYRLPGQLAKAK